MAALGEAPIAALDIGSSKVSALVVQKDDDGAIKVLGSGQRESKGVKRGYITDMEISEVAVREAVDLAERMSGVTVDEVWAGFAAGGLVSDVANVEVELGGHPVEESDIAELLAAGRAAIDREGQVVLHAHPALYTIDGVQGVKNPRGLHAGRLGVDIHVIAADEAPLRNLDYVIRSAHLGVRAIVASTAASAEAVLTEDERDLGVALVELGADVTNVSLHAGGMLVGLRSIPLGARDVTEDIAMAFGVPRRDAERMKCFYGSAMQSPRDNHEMIDAQVGASGEPMRITRAQLVTVIRQRTEEICNEVDAALRSLGFSGPVGRQVVVTGGGAELKNVDDYMGGVLGRQVRVGRPRGLPGLPDALSGPASATLIGLALMAAKGDDGLHDIALKEAARTARSGGLLSRLIRALKEGY
ncbi:cell division protein FtsA [Sphingomicrobium lutaoense]|uniref:Cell division protein FtsA n=2 Tax=Sphingomicrobium lutaoense TaxID=515949 RepID=A0A839YVV6_9SPHN|nr:cell division protein FtsA [Sphingomicrobium lutaoense]MBB3764351.1 cell division protein FtsA [Sphingomicrobium lutaoense]